MPTLSRSSSPAENHSTPHSPSGDQCFQALGLACSILRPPTVHMQAVAPHLCGMVQVIPQRTATSHPLWTDAPTLSNLSGLYPVQPSLESTNSGSVLGAPSWDLSYIQFLKFSLRFPPPTVYYPITLYPFLVVILMQLNRCHNFLLRGGCPSVMMRTTVFPLNHISWDSGQPSGERRRYNCAALLLFVLMVAHSCPFRFQKINGVKGTAGKPQRGYNDLGGKNKFRCNRDDFRSFPFS